MDGHYVTTFPIENNKSWPVSINYISKFIISTVRAKRTDDVINRHAQRPAAITPVSCLLLFSQ